MTGVINVQTQKDIMQRMVTKRSQQMELPDSSQVNMDSMRGLYHEQGEKFSSLSACDPFLTGIEFRHVPIEDFNGVRAANLR